MLYFTHIFLAKRCTLLYSMNKFSSRRNGKNALEPAYRIESPEAIPCCPQLRYSNKNYVQGRM